MISAQCCHILSEEVSSFISVQRHLCITPLRILQNEMILTKKCAFSKAETSKLTLTNGGWPSFYPIQLFRAEKQSLKNASSDCSLRFIKTFYMCSVCCKKCHTVLKTSIQQEISTVGSKNGKILHKKTKIGRLKTPSGCNIKRKCIWWVQNLFFLNKRFWITTAKTCMLVHSYTSLIKKWGCCPTIRSHIQYILCINPQPAVRCILCVNSLNAPRRQRSLTWQHIK